ncbi:histidine kinase [Arcobacter suis]|uniref:histidine kinase n=1 Tax=Arcobacter suis CECT 7833 TaxID=663365 RepID=A0AAD0WPS0_9BACT|nr:sensor histidine kinase [Arcobacter suis]AXX89010.1 7TMR-DISM-7TM domain-containing two-component system sensor histidine kinase [Arcobacter suis CECT 7833]RWS48053.1 histidine kinase [Arcobacter suis]
MKYLILFTLFFSNLFSSDLIKDYVAEDHINFKDLSFFEYRDKQLSEFTIKFDVNLEQLKDETYYLTIVSDEKSLIYTNAIYETINDIMVIKLDKYQKKELFFKYKYKESKQAEFRWKYINNFEYKYLLKYEGILYGVAYGIIFCAFLYYLIIYFSSQTRYFLYYSIMQLFVLLTLCAFTYLSYKSYVTTLEQALTDIFETGSLLFTLLFAKEVLNTKVTMPFMNKIILILIGVNILDIFAIFIFKYSILYEYMPFYVSFFISTLAGLISVFQKNYLHIVYTLGWFIVFLFLFLTELDSIEISGIYTVHLSAPIESLIFSFALGYTLKKMVEEKNEKEKLLIHQSKLASMGEMINNIAHQWRQPLTHLGFINMNLQLAFEDEPLDKKYLKEKIEESNAQLDFMSKTIDNFRDFYKPNKQKEIFYISVAVKKALEIMEPIFESNKIEFEFNVIKDKQINAYENEYSQVILNILTNAKDVLISRQIQNPKIIISINEKNDSIITTILDNAGGIENKYINHIFDPYFTTKQKGSGIGLYMSKMIIESHFKGKIKVFNKDKGASFSIEV